MSFFRKRTALVWLVVLLAWAPPARADDGGTIIEGVATTPDGQPLPGATLFFLEVPPSQSAPSLGADTTVVTDANGRFAWKPPAGLASTLGASSPPPGCYALPVDRRVWSYAVSLLADTSGQEAAFRASEHEVLEAASRKCETRWQIREPGAKLIVVVPAVGVATVKVTAPDGRPLARKAIQVAEAEPSYSVSGVVVYTATTGDDGTFHWRGFSKVRRLTLLAPGVGFGSTGTFELLPAAEVHPTAPPLAPFASVAGRLVPPPAQPGATVADDISFNWRQWYRPRATVDADGRFTLDNLMPGEHQFQVTGAGRAMKSVLLPLSPGESVANLVFEAIPAAKVRQLSLWEVGQAEMAAKAATPAPRTTTAAPELRGRITDAGGRPVKGAEVFARCDNFNGFSMARHVFTSVTNADGTYLISGLPVSASLPFVSMVATVPGRAPAFAEADMDSISRSVTSGVLVQEPVPNYRADLVIPEGRTSLTIKVFQGRKPVAGVTVNARPQPETASFDGFFGGRGNDPTAIALNRKLEPTATTDARGEVHFYGLTPGLWDIFATAGAREGAIEGVGQTNYSPIASPAFGIVRGVSVAVDRPVVFGLNVYEQPNQVAVQVLGPDGLAPSQEISVTSGAAAGKESGAGLSIESPDTQKYGFGKSGLWKLTARFRSTPGTNVRPNTEPVNVGNAIFAISPAVSPKAPALIRTVRREPGRIRVILQDAMGRPATGTVTINEGAGIGRYGASMDARGEAVLPDMPSGEYRLAAAYAPVTRPPALGTEDTAFPADEALSHLSMLIPQTASIVSGRETVVTFRPQPVGYLRGKIIAPDEPRHYAVFTADTSDTKPVIRYDSRTGEYLAGPFLPGEAILDVVRLGTAGESRRELGIHLQIRSSRTTAVVRAGKVTRAGLSTPPPELVPIADAIESQKPLPTYPLTGQVFLSDGKTPAWGARAVAFEPGKTRPVQRARTGPDGRLRVVPEMRLYETPSPQPPGSPTERVTVAWLPGATGATILPSVGGGEARIVLPPPVSVGGRVTVSGKSISGLDSTFRVLAAYQGRGTLNDILSVDTTAQADGSFELAGLTPGTYLVQAARDGIWVSRAKKLVIRADGRTPSPDVLVLDIGRPGAPVVLRVVNKAGKRLAEQRVALMRPFGPLTETLWPTELVTDGAGELRLDGLEAGTHRMELVFEATVAAPARSQEFSVKVPFFAAGRQPESLTAAVQ